ncbi:MAG: Gfo/Idh/MocA family oxidoreductase [Armatimonadetes bacterium]|nr:Gfo/Idh/MocA family oxidoreductase [Armatimonadota bacterium]
MLEKVRLGFVGTGGIANHHLKQLKEIPETEIVALCDVVAERAQARAQEFGGRAFVDYRRMLDEVEIDALYVCVPPPAHDDIELRAAARGIHLFVEKPVTLSLAQALEIRAAVREAGILTCTGYVLRHLPSTQAALRYLKGKTVAMAVASRWGGLPAMPWWRVMAQSGGQLVEMTTHQVDLMRYLVGEIVEVHARYAHRTLAHTPTVTVPDVQIATFQFANGAIGSVTTSCALTQGGGKCDLDFILQNALLHYTTRELRVTPEGAPQPESVGDTLSINQAFIRAVATGDRSPILCDYDEGVRTLDVTLTANRSAETGRPGKTYFSEHE